MIVNPIRDGVVLDHITSGKAFELYFALGLDKLTCQVAIIHNAASVKMGRKDILKICEPIELDFDVLGYLDPGITVNIIKNSEVVERRIPRLPKTLTGILKCSNPRCISSVEQELPQVFVLTDEKAGVYRCRYCEARYKNTGDLH